MIWHEGRQEQSQADPTFYERPGVVETGPGKGGRYKNRLHSGWECVDNEVVYAREEFSRDVTFKPKLNDGQWWGKAEVGAVDHRTCMMNF